jgi:hypothetical protein
MIKKGYVFTFIFSTFVAVSRSLYYRMFIRQDLSVETLPNLVLQVTMMFIFFFLPLLFAVRWYYSMKDRNNGY